MPLARRRLRFDPARMVALGLLCAAIVIVVYLQQRALVKLDEQSMVILENILDQTAGDIARDIRTALDAPTYDVLTTLNRAQLQEDGLQRVLRMYQEAIHKYPQIDRFFLWSQQTDARIPGEVLFFNRHDAPDDQGVHYPGAGASQAIGAEIWRALSRDPELGRRIYLDVYAATLAPKSYMVLEYRSDCGYDVLAVSWLEPEYDGLFFVMGFVVCRETAGQRLMSALHEDHIAGWLSRSDGGPPLALHVFDERRQSIFNSAPFVRGISRNVTLSGLLYPADLPILRVAAEQGPREWTVLVSSSSPDLATIRTQTHWLLGVSVLLILVALTAAIRGQRRAAELAAMQSDFVSHVSHQLRTPLSLLTTLTETLALDRVKSPERQAEYFDILRAETKRLSSMVEHVLEFSRVNGRGLTYQFEPVALVPLVRESVGAFAQKPAAQGFRIEMQDDGSEPIVRADSAALEQALVNLLDNAVKYSDHARDVAVRVRSATGEALVEVEDHGSGIPASEQPWIFGRFYRGGGASQRSGFGLGLAIVKEIIKEHRGRIEVESTPGRGSLFRIRLPRRESAA